MPITVPCTECDEEMHLAVQPVERRRPLPPNERPTMIPFTFDEWLCPNGHFRDLTYSESRFFE